MNKPTYAEIREFKEYLYRNGCTADRDETIFEKCYGDNVRLEITFHYTTKGDFKDITAVIKLPIYGLNSNSLIPSRILYMKPVRTLDREYVLRADAAATQILGVLAATKAQIEHIASGK